MIVDRDTALRLQGRLGVKQDGVAGPVTLAAFFGAVAGRYPRGPDIVAIGAAAAACFPDAGIATPLRLAHWTAQAAHETGGFATFVENLNYSADGLVKTWPTRFTAQSAAALAHKPEAIANVAYADRMGNGPPGSGDGWRYRGRGIFQITGRDNYHNCGQILRLDLDAHPDIAAAPGNATRIAAAFWSLKAMAVPADRDDIAGVTRLVNGGLNGIEDRRRYLDKAKALLA